MSHAIPPRPQPGSGQPAHFRLLLDSLQPIRTVDAGLADAAAAFVLHGEEPDVLERLRRHSDLDGLHLGQPGRLTRPFMESLYSDATVLEAARIAVQARNEFYGAVDADTTPVALLRRFGLLLEAVDRGASLEQAGLPLPGWMLYLLHDVAASTVRFDVAQRARKPRRPGWRFAMLDALLADEADGAALTLLLPFERSGIDKRYDSPLLHLLGWADCAAWFEGHAELFRARYGTLSDSGRRTLAEVLGSEHPLAGLFPDLLIPLSVDATKAVRNVAAEHLLGIPETTRLAGFGRLLRTGSQAERRAAAAELARIDRPESRALLQAALRDAPPGALEQALRQALALLDSSAAAGASVPGPAPVATAPVFPDEIHDLLRRNWLALRAEYEAAARREIEENAAAGTHCDTEQTGWRSFQKLDESDVRRLFEQLNGAGGDAALIWSKRDIVFRGDEIYRHPAVGLGHLLRLFQLHGRFYLLWEQDAFQHWLRRQPPGGFDLRLFAAHVARCGGDLREVAAAALVDAAYVPQAQDILPAEAVWPFFAEHPEYLEEALRMRPPADGRNEFDIGRGLEVLSLFPQLPAALLPGVFELALYDTTHGRRARALIEGVPDPVELIVGKLGSSRPESRSAAASWLAELKASATVPALYATLDRETDDTVRAALRVALEDLGEDIAPFLTPAALSGEAVAGLRGGLPAGCDGFPFESLPAVHWAADGHHVDPAVIRWWLVLACKLKQPGGNPLIERYLGLLQPADAARLGSFVLRAFIDADTLRPSPDEALAYARAEAPARLQHYRDRARREPEFAGRTLDDCLEELAREKLATYSGSLIAAKGMLALAIHVPGPELAGLIRAYMRHHPGRRAQIEALLEVAGRSGDPSATQLLLAVARRGRGAAARARALVEDLAGRHGWTPGQLADRTIPWAGFDAHGEQVLEYGARRFTITLDAVLKPVLRDPEGRVMPSLPEPLAGDDPERIRLATAQWSACRTELEQVIELQTERLYESMCVSRIWPAADWRDWLLAHPVVGRLVQRLVWMRLDADGAVSLFRPTGDGTLIDLDAAVIGLPDTAGVRLAHAALLDADQRRLWLRHLQDHAIEQPFEQFGRPPLPAAVEEAGRTRIDDRLGWLSDTFTLRNALLRLGYQRGVSGDAGFFDHYFKVFTDIGLRVCIDFSGNYLPERNVAAVLKTLRVERPDGRVWRDASLPLAEVPPVLLSEAYADYLAVADVCSGFDPDWETKQP